jgi:hypothetical protein
VKEAIPDPIFSLPSDLAWNGTDSLLVTPVISNLAAIKASAQPHLRYSWTMADLAADTAWRDSGLMLKTTSEGGELTLGLCLDNNGPAICKSMTVSVKAATGLMPSAAAGEARKAAPAFDARGRRILDVTLRPGGHAPVFRTVRDGRSFTSSAGNAGKGARAETVPPP